MLQLFRLSLFVTVLFFLPLASQAQFQASLTPELSLEVSPKYPKPGQEVTLTLQDYGTGSFGSSITWTIDGAVVEAAANQRSITTTAGALGTTRTVRAVLQTPTSGQQVAAATISPVYVDIILEPQTHTPSFYSGRSIPSIGSVVNATAIVSTGQALNQANLLYTWRVNQTVINGGPLRGGSKISFPMPMGKAVTVYLDVKTSTGADVASYAVQAPSVEPRVVFYSTNSLYGTTPRALTSSNSVIIGSGSTIQAAPFNLDSQVYNNPSISNWTINGRTIATGNNNPYTITLQSNSAGSRSTLGFQVRSTEQILQGASANVSITN